MRSESLVGEDWAFAAGREIAANSREDKMKLYFMRKALGVQLQVI